MAKTTKKSGGAPLTFHDISTDRARRYIVATPGLHVFFLKNRCGDIEFVLTRSDTEARIFGIHDAGSTTRCELTITQRHRAPRTTSQVLIRSILRDHTRFSFRGLIRIDDGAHDADARLVNNNLLLSPHAMADTRPQLEIIPDDVVCTHAATTGPVGDEQLFFLRSRGLTRARATQLLVEGFTRDVYAMLHSLNIHPHV